MKRTLILFALIACSLSLSVLGQQAPGQQPTNQQPPKSTDSTPSADKTKPKSAAEEFPFPEAEAPTAPPHSSDAKSTDTTTKPKSAAEQFPFPEAEAPTAPPHSDPRSPSDSSSTDHPVDISPPPDDNQHEGSDLLGPEPAPGVSEMTPWNPHKADKDVEVGMFYFKQKNYPAAESRFRGALHWQDNHAEATYRLATVLQKEGKSPEAKQYYLQYLKILPNGEFAKDCRKALDRISGEGSKAENTPPTSQP
jgi:tetratricopeptide (TPR) repeat protein